jgi:hypothetical protein
MTVLVFAVVLISIVTTLKKDIWNMVRNNAVLENDVAGKRMLTFIVRCQIV